MSRRTAEAYGQRLVEINANKKAQLPAAEGGIRQNFWMKFIQQKTRGLGLSGGETISTISKLLYTSSRFDTIPECHG